MNHLLKISLFAGLLAIAFALTLTGCNNQDSCPEQSADSAQGCATNDDAAQLANAGTMGGAAGKAVTRVVFVDKRFACDCIQKKITSTWAALEKTLPADGSIPVETIHYDTQREDVDPYIKQKALVALPAIYFIDEQDQVVQILQGDVDQQMLSQVLGGES